MEINKGNIKYITHILNTEFPTSTIQKSDSGIYCVLIAKNSINEIFIAFQLFNKKGSKSKNSIEINRGSLIIIFYSYRI